MEKLRILILFVIVASFGASAMIGCGRGVAVQDPSSECESWRGPTQKDATRV